MITINDPIHGVVEVSPDEIKLIDSRPFQRLRHIKQLGFSELAFPGATHTRYSHSMGAMAMATRMADRLLGDLPIDACERERIAETVRLAVLFHDLGHPPMSHVSECVMPQIEDLELGLWIDEPNRQATHEDYTVKLLVDSELTQLIEQRFGDRGITGARLAGLIVGKPPPGDPDAFKANGVDLLPLLSQVVSSEMDADRMDYLRRDAYYCGVSYGNFDHIWLTSNLVAVEHEGRQAMALLHKGVWAFENFLLARYHMFLSVYYHHTAICFDHLLRRWYDEGAYSLPGDSAGYLATDDVDLIAAMRKSESEWAKRVVDRRPYRLLVETHSSADGSAAPVGEVSAVDLDQRLTEAGIDFFRVQKRAVLSKYFKKRERTFPLLVVEPERGKISRIEDYTPLYRRFEEATDVERVFCRPEQRQAARALL